jgi:hypothetical protein
MVIRPEGKIGQDEEMQELPTLFPTGIFLIIPSDYKEIR